MTEEPRPRIQAGKAEYREVAYEHSRHFLPCLERLGVSLLISTYQAGKLICVGTHENRLSLSFNSFESPMGIAVGRRGITLGTRNQVWHLRRETEQVARGIAADGKHDRCYVAAKSLVTGDIRIHEIAQCGSEALIVNTLFSCLCTTDERFSFIPRWKPSFVGQLVAEDRCHLNGIAVEKGQPRYVSVLAESDEPAGWRRSKATGGALIDIGTNRIIARGFAMPHSPRVHGGQVLVLNSGFGNLSSVDPSSGATTVIAELPGYTRGMAIYGGLAFVGLSKIRETSIFSDIPIADRQEELRCGIGVVHLGSRQTIATLEFKSGVEEIFDIQVIPGARCPAIIGPNPIRDDMQAAWIVPPTSIQADGSVPQLAESAT